MTSSDLLYIVLAGVYGWVAALHMRAFLRYRKKERLGMAMLLIAAMLGFILTSKLSAPWPWLVQPGLVLGVSAPLLLAWLLHTSQALPAWQRAVFGGGALLSTVDILVLWRPVGVFEGDIDLYAVLPAAHFVVSQILLAVALYKRAPATRGVVRSRFGMAAAACALSVAALVLVCLGEAPLSLMLWRGALGGAAACVWLAFGAPGWLVQLLNAGELYRYLQRKEQHPLTQQAKAVPEELCGLAVQATGATGALLAFWLEDQAQWQVAAGHMGTAVGPGKALSGVNPAWWSQGRPAASLLAAEQADVLAQTAFSGAVSYLYLVPLAIAEEGRGLLLVGLPHRPLFPEDDLGLLCLLAGLGSQDLAVERAHRAMLAKYTDQTVANRVLADPRIARPGGSRQNATVLFADIRGFSRWAEVTQTEHVMAVLNRFFDVAVGQAHQHRGTVTHLEGDGLMVLFTAERHGEGHAQAAARTAAGIIRMAAGIGHESLREPLGVGCGINTGEVVIGHIGSDNRLVYTAVGDPVNVARRIMEAAGAGEVYVSEATASHLRDTRLEPLGVRKVKNRTGPVALYRMRGRENE